MSVGISSQEIKRLVDDRFQNFEKNEINDFKAGLVTKAATVMQNQFLQEMGLAIKAVLCTSAVVGVTAGTVVAYSYSPVGATLTSLFVSTMWGGVVGGLIGIVGGKMGERVLLDTISQEGWFKQS